MPKITKMKHLNSRSFLRFLAVGGSATLLHYAIMFGLIQTGLSAAWASACGYTLSTFYNYWANARFTFEGQHDHAHSLPRFLLTAGAGLAINQLVLISLTFLGLATAFAQILATGCVLIWNFIINAVWSFREKSPS